MIVCGIKKGCHGDLYSDGKSWNGCRFGDWILQRMERGNQLDGTYIDKRRNHSADICRPLPRGEVRDMPEDAKIHNSAIRRMKAVPTYRPGNLILGGGGRGVITAPESAGIGEWEICANGGDVVRESVKRKPKVTEEKKKKHHANGGQNGKSEKL